MSDSDSEPYCAVRAAHTSPTPRRCVRVRSSGSSGSRSGARVRPPDAGAASAAAQASNAPPMQDQSSTIVSEIMKCWESAAKELGIDTVLTSGNNPSSIAQPPIRPRVKRLLPHPALPPNTDATPASLPRIPVVVNGRCMASCMPEDSVTTTYSTQHDASTNNAALADEFSNTLDGLRFHGCGPLHIAAFCGHTGIVESLAPSLPAMAMGADAQGCTPLHFAAHQGHAAVVASLLSYAQSASNAVDDRLRSALHYAACRGHADVVEVLWANGADVDATDADGWTALHYAANGGHLEVASKLIIAGTHVNAVDGVGHTPAHLAAQRGHAAVLERLLGAGYLVNTVNKHHCTMLWLHRVSGICTQVVCTGCTALHYAAAAGHASAARVLLGAGANADAVDAHGRTAVLLAAAAGGDAVDVLWQAGAPLPPPTATGQGILHYACHGGNMRLVRQLLDTEDVDVNQATATGRTPLFYAARGGHASLMTLLLEAGADAQLADTWDNTAWHAAAAAPSPAACRTLPDANVHAANCTGWTALHFAAIKGRVETLSYLLELGADASATCQAGASPLHLAAQSASAAAVSVLLKANPAIDAADDRGWTALHHAAHGGGVDVLDALLSAGAACRVCSEEGLTPLHLAVCSAQAVQRLLDAGADRLALDGCGCTAAHYAAQLGDHDAFSRLCKEGDVVPDDVHGHSLVHYAAEGGSTAIMQAALQGHTSAAPSGTPPPPPWSPLHIACLQGHAPLLPLLLLHGSWAAHDRGVDGGTALHYAARGMVDDASCAACGQCMLAMLGAGCPVNSPDAAGCCPLHYAAGAGCLAAVDALIKAGAVLLTRDAAAWTPLTWAAANGHAPVVSRLLDLDVPPLSVDTRRRTPLHWAAEAGCVEVVSLLLATVQPSSSSSSSEGGSSSGDGAELPMTGPLAPVVAPDADGASPVLLAARRGYVDIVAALLDDGAERTTKQLTALHLAAAHGLLDVVPCLLNARPRDVHAATADGLLPLHVAALADSADVAALLLDAGANVDAPAADGSSALVKAASMGHGDVVQLLLSRGARADARGVRGCSALHHAAMAGHASVVQQLLDAGCSPNQQADNGTTAFFAAADEGHADVAALLLRAGAGADVAGVGVDALHAAATGGHTAVVKLLLEAGADVDAQSQGGCTPLHNACTGGFADVASVLLAAGADVDVQNASGNTALHLAASKGFLDIVDGLLQASCDVHIKNAKLLQAIHTAATAGFFDVVLKLVQYGASWRHKGAQEGDIVKLICKKTSYKPTYVEGRLRLAERARQRARPPPSDEGHAPLQSLEALQAAADANMRALLQEEDAAKEAAARRSKKREKNRKKKEAAAKDEVDDTASPTDPLPPAEEPEEGPASPTTVNAAPLLSSSPMTARRAPPSSPARSDGSGRVVTVVAVRRKGSADGARDAGKNGKEGEWRETTKHQAHKDQGGAKKGTALAVVKKPHKAEPMPTRIVRGKATPLPVKPTVNGHDADAKLSAAFKHQASLHGTSSPAHSPASQRGASPSSSGKAVSPQPAAPQPSPVALKSPAPATARAWKQPAVVVPPPPASTPQQWPPLPSTAAASPIPPKSPVTTVRASQPLGGPGMAGMTGMAVQADDLWALPLLADSNATPPAIPVPAPPPQPVEAVFTPFFSPSTSIWSAGNGSLGAAPPSVAASPQTPAEFAAARPQGDAAVPDSIKSTARLYGMCCPLTQELIHDPVVASDGYTYEKAAIQAWLTSHDVSPVTHHKLPHKELVPNLTMRSAMRLLLH